MSDAPKLNGLQRLILESLLSYPHPLAAEGVIAGIKETEVWKANPRPLPALDVGRELSVLRRRGLVKSETMLVDRKEPRLVGGLIVDKKKINVWSIADDET